MLRSCCANINSDRCQVVCWYVSVKRASILAQRCTRCSLARRCATDATERPLCLERLRKNPLIKENALCDPHKSKKIPIM